MAVFVLVSGAWLGSWAWRAVVPRLRRDGHDVRTPSLTGLAERAHVRSAEPITFSTHVQDVVDLLYCTRSACVHERGWAPLGPASTDVCDTHEDGRRLPARDWEVTSWTADAI